MKKELLVALRMTVVTLVLTGLAYPLLVTAVARVAFPVQAAGSLVDPRRPGRRLGADRPGVHEARLLPAPALGRGQRLRRGGLVRLEPRPDVAEAAGPGGGGRRAAAAGEPAGPGPGAARARDHVRQRPRPAREPRGRALAGAAGGRRARRRRRPRSKLSCATASSPGPSGSSASRASTSCSSTSTSTGGSARPRTSGASR